MTYYMNDLSIPSLKIFLQFKKKNSKNPKNLKFPFIYDYQKIHIFLRGRLQMTS